MTEVETKSLGFDKVLTAAAKAMGEIKKVGKEGRNLHDKYNFASIDNFLAMANPICADAGLVFLMQEDGIEDFTRKGKYGDSSWMRMRWQVTVYHISGQSLPPVFRTVEVLRNGAQAYGSAQSFALKQFLRAFLLIATGDKDDADLMPTDDGPVDAKDEPRQEQRKPAPPVVSSEAVKQACEYLAGADDMAHLQRLWSNAPRDIQAHLDVIKAKDDRKRELQLAETADQIANPAADLAGDNIPY